MTIKLTDDQIEAIKLVKKDDQTIEQFVTVAISIYTLGLLQEQLK